MTERGGCSRVCMAIKRILLRFLFCFFCLIVFGGFRGCLNEQVGKGFAGHQPRADNLVGYVDTRAGTGGLMWASGHNTPAACAPHGMMKLGPDTAWYGRIWSSSGYNYGDTQMVGFSHTRYSGTGAWAD